MKYAFNENIKLQAGTPGQVVTMSIAGFTVQATVEADGYAKVNASPFYQAAFAGEAKNGNDTFNTQKTVDGETVKYGYMDFDEQEERFGTQRSRYNERSEVGRCQAMLRWLDHYGNWCYWVFEKGSTTYTDVQRGESLTGLLGNKSIVQRPQMKANAKSIKLCALKVDEETFEFIAEVKKSIHVCLSGENEWVPVVVSAGSSAWVVDGKRMNRQDFEITVTVPENVLSL